VEFFVNELLSWRIPVRIVQHTAMANASLNALPYSGKKDYASAD
jgi:hypothetical protein